LSDEDEAHPAQDHCTSDGGQQPGSNRESLYAGRIRCSVWFGVRARLASTAGNFVHGEPLHCADIDTRIN
jgi:hypothetical protein